MQRLIGIGVSPGVVAGRAVLLIQRSQVLRYQIAPARVDHELRRLDESRSRSRDQLVEIRARVAERRPEIAALFVHVADVVDPAAHAKTVAESVSITTLTRPIKKWKYLRDAP